MYFTASKLLSCWYCTVSCGLSSYMTSWTDFLPHQFDHCLCLNLHTTLKWLGFLHLCRALSQHMSCFTVFAVFSPFLCFRGLTLKPGCSKCQAPWPLLLSSANFCTLCASTLVSISALSHSWYPQCPIISLPPLKFH